MERPQDSELMALSGVLANPVLKELLRSIFAEQAVACFKDCKEHALANEPHLSVLGAARGEAFLDVTPILEQFVEKYGRPEGPEEKEE
jgi:hypothetical protein